MIMIFYDEKPVFRALYIFYFGLEPRLRRIPPYKGGKIIFIKQRHGTASDCPVQQIRILLERKTIEKQCYILL